MIYRTIDKNFHGAYVVGSFVFDTTEANPVPFWFHHTFYGYSKRYAIKLYNDIIKDRKYKYDKS
jgi:hypothetical protein